MMRSGSPNPFRVLPGWSYFGPRFFPFFRLLLSLGFLIWSADGGIELFDEERFFSLDNASFNCSISCCCSSISCCFSASFRCCCLSCCCCLSSHSPRDSIVCTIFSTAMAISGGSLVSADVLSMKPTILYLRFFGSTPYYACSCRPMIARCPWQYRNAVAVSSYVFFKLPVFFFCGMVFFVWLLISNLFWRD